MNNLNISDGLQVCSCDFVRLEQAAAPMAPRYRDGEPCAYDSLISPSEHISPSHLTMNKVVESGGSYQPLYHALDPSKQEIRLLTSLRVYAKDRVKCKLITVPLRTCPPFTALSYVWGEDADRVPIRVNGQVFQATKSLASALRYVPRHWKSKFPGRNKTELRIWADAVCINQSDPDERAHQVQLMKGVFSGAEMVMCWMPNATKNWRGDISYDDDQKDKYVRTAFETFELINEELRFIEKESGGTILEMDRSDERLVRWLEKCPKLRDCTTCSTWPFWENKNWYAVYYFFRLQYWNRLWILQEVILAREPLLFCKSSSLSLPDTFSRVMAWFFVLRWGRVLAPSYVPHGLWYSLITGNGLSYERAYTQWRVWMSRHTTREAIPPWLLFSNTFTFTATESKDYVYGILGVIEMDIEVDYSERTSSAKVLRDAIAVWLKQYQESENGDLAAQAAVGSLHALMFLPVAGLRRECASAECQGFASWTPNPSHSKHDSDDPLYFRKVNADNGVFLDKALRTASIQGSSLFVTGVVIDSVHELYTSIREFSDLAPFLLGLSSLHNDFQELPGKRRLLRCLFELLCWEDIPTSVLDAKLNGSSPASHEYLVYACAFLLGLLSAGRQYGAILESLGLRTDSEEGFMLSLCETFLDLDYDGSDRAGDEATLSWLQDLLDFETTGEIPRDSKVAHCCRQMGIIPFQDGMGMLGTSGVIFRTSRDYFGFGTPMVAVGDLACVLKGYRSIALLRENENHFVFVGECKVEGMVNGEAAELVKNGKSRVGEFELR